MINLNRKPRKSEEELLFDQLNKQYTERFGEPYVFNIGIDGESWAEPIASIRKCLETDQPRPAPDYVPGLIY